MDILKQQILAKDPGAAVRAKQLGRPANPMLLDFAKNEDADLRRVAMYCLRETGGPEAAKAMIAALADEEPQVAAVAAGGLHKLFDPAFAPQLIQALDKAEEGSTRYEIALLLGRMDKAVDLKEFAKRRAADQDPRAQEGHLAAFARLGDKPSQEEFVRLLQASKERELRRFLAHVAYISQPWVLKPLVPLLDRKENLVRYGVDARPTSDINLRTCDVATSVAMQVSQRKFTFKMEEYKPYTDPQIDEVRRYLKGLP